MSLSCVRYASGGDSDDYTSRPTLLYNLYHSCEKRIKRFASGYNHVIPPAKVSNPMSDRKYRQSGYQDDARDRPVGPKAARPPREPGAPAGARRLSQDGPKPVNMHGYREVVRCSQCGAPVTAEIGLATQCPQCGTDLHACAQCASFDPGSPFECMQPIKARVSPKNGRNDCPLFAPRTKVEREVTAPRRDDPRKAFHDLFKI